MLKSTVNITPSLEAAARELRNQYERNIGDIPSFLRYAIDELLSALDAARVGDHFSHDDIGFAQAEEEIKRCYADLTQANARIKEVEAEHFKLKTLQDTNKTLEAEAAKLKLKLRNSRVGPGAKGY